MFPSNDKQAAAPVSAGARRASGGRTSVGTWNRPQGKQPVYVFGPFRLLAQARQLFRGTCPVRLGGRALDLLLVLVDRAGDVVSRAELERTIWPGSVVEDSCLRVHIGALRKALGDGAGAARYIANVPGRGYSFVAPLTTVEPDAAPAQPACARPLPVRMTSVLGRDEALDQLRALVPRRRLVTIVGHGGVGKTALALCLAEELRAAHADGACFVDLAPLTSARQIPDALATALGLEPAGAQSEGDAGADVGADLGALLERWLAPRRILVVLDNCEHLIEAATALAEHLLRLGPGINVVATSREPLDADGEWVLRLGPLACPPDDAALDLERALAYPALQLLVNRAEASMDSFRLSKADLPAAIRLCRRVDGVPLALEFAAAQVALLGIRGVAEQMGERQRLLGSGRRTVVARHRTVRALLDWSYDLLSPHERRVLRHCAVFAGPFSLEAALAVVGDDAGACVVGCILALVSKSLIVADTQGPDARFMLLGVTRAHAIDLLAEDPARHALAQRHARYMLGQLDEFARNWDVLGPVAWLAGASHMAADLRAALDWAFGPGGERALGVRLAAVPAMMGANLLGENEQGRYVRAALDAIEGCEAGTAADPLLVARLHAASGREVADWTLYERAVAHAEAAGRPQALAEAWYLLALRRQGAGMYRSARDSAQCMERVAAQAGLPRALALARRLLAASLHLLGEHDAALRLADQASGAAPPLRLAAPVAHGPERCMLAARIRWLQGQGRPAAALARDGLALAARDGAPASLAWALAFGALPVALWRGDDDWARELAGQLEAHAERHALAGWSRWARLYRQVLLIRGGGVEVAQCGSWRGDTVQGEHLATFLGGVAVAASEQRCAQGQVGWCAAEVWRASGERLLQRGGCEAHAEALFIHGLGIARRQGARAWELRCATSLARLWRARESASDHQRAQALLEPLVRALDAAHDGADLSAALVLLRG